MEKILKYDETTDLYETVSFLKNYINLAEGEALQHYNFKAILVPVSVNAEVKFAAILHALYLGSSDHYVVDECFNHNDDMISSLNTSFDLDELSYVEGYTQYFQSNAAVLMEYIKRGWISCDRSTWDDEVQKMLNSELGSQFVEEI